jgi:hypothetical protein
MNGNPVTTTYEYRLEDIERHARLHRAGTLESDCDCDRCAVYAAYLDGTYVILRPDGDGRLTAIYVYPI